jgi:predicted nucleic acid-binding protein
MIVLDTNVVSETMKPQPDAAVLAWLDRQVIETLYLTSITLAELWFGIAAIPAGKRRDRLAAVLDGAVGQFGGRVLPFDVDAARHHATLALAARKAGLGFPVPDGYIAAIAASRGFIVASRDVSAFVAGRLVVIDPWTEL